MQVIHADNVSNRLRGQRVSPIGYLDSFPGLLDDLPEPSKLDWAEEVFVYGPLRVVRDGARALAKRVILAMGGRKGIEAVYQRWNALRSRVKL